MGAGAGRKGAGAGRKGDRGRAQGGQGQGARAGSRGRAHAPTLMALSPCSPVMATIAIDLQVIGEGTRDMRRGCETRRPVHTVHTPMPAPDMHAWPGPVQGVQALASPSPSLDRG
jgi:hypothetical protein